ncbi:hypothetical protein GCM10011609_84830 [Lentzea pudingi]|uniref:2Fe-2S ferredoxin-type domain-containing protein n=1 Tax=Lentzea pudingi TaxID=1789439 RepID=A0ABQ2IRW3_9PSEU|nr:hypothetical protein GCM10011609_84830 [Lentzea pudingi]
MNELAREPNVSRTVSVRLSVNGEEQDATVDPRMTLLDLLRDELGRTGTKVGCNHNTCGACTVQVDGRRVLPCLTLAASADGRSVRTIEGMAAPDGGLHSLQQAFVDEDALQCGFCTPGQLMSAEACIREGTPGRTTTSGST